MFLTKSIFSNWFSKGDATENLSQKAKSPDSKNAKQAAEGQTEHPLFAWFLQNWAKTAPTTEETRHAGGKQKGSAEEKPATGHKSASPPQNLQLKKSEHHLAGQTLNPRDELPHLGKTLAGWNATDDFSSPVPSKLRPETLQYLKQADGKATSKVDQHLGQAPKLQQVDQRINRAPNPNQIDPQVKQVQNRTTKTSQQGATRNQMGQKERIAMRSAQVTKLPIDQISEGAEPQGWVENVSRPEIRIGKWLTESGSVRGMVQAKGPLQANPKPLDSPPVAALAEVSDAQKAQPSDKRRHTTTDHKTLRKYTLISKRKTAQTLDEAHPMHENPATLKRVQSKPNTFKSAVKPSSQKILTLPEHSQPESTPKKGAEAQPIMPTLDPTQAPSSPEHIKAPLKPSLLPLPQQLEQGILAAIRQVPKSVLLKLEPEQLGEITIRVGLERDRVHAHIACQNDQVAAMIQDSKSDLDNALKQKGYQLNQFDIHKDSGQQAFQQQQHTQNPERPASAMPRLRLGPKQAESQPSRNLVVPAGYHTDGPLNIVV